MKAVQCTSYGDPSQLKVADVDPPIPRPSQVLVKVHASSVNPIDWKLYDGRLRFLSPRKFPYIPGIDVAGEVVEVGSAVTEFKVGDRLYAYIRAKESGAAAEYAAFEETVAALWPDGLNAHEAAAVPTCGLTALKGLRDQGGLQDGDHALIVGASGGVGHYAVQVAKALGAHVTGVCSTANVAMVRELGADHVIDYKKESGLEGEGAPYDVILDCVISQPYSSFQPVMKNDGTYVSLLPSFGLLLRGVLMLLYTRRRAAVIITKPSGDGLRFLGKLVGEGKLRSVVDSVYPLEQLQAAHEKSQTRRARGKIVIDHMSGASV